MPETREIDLRTLPPAMRHGLVFQTFDRLETGESFVIVNDHDPMPLLQQFRFVRPGESEHEYLERGPLAWQVRIARKAAGDRAADPAGGPAAADAPATVTAYLEGDHRRLDALLADVERLAGDGAYLGAASRLAELASGLGRHIDVEEQILFPVFEEATGMSAGPTRVMRDEHVEIHHWLREATGCLARQDGHGLARSLESLTQVLSAHNMKEEHMLYPMTDRSMPGDAERRALVSQMVSF